MKIKQTIINGLNKIANFVANKWKLAALSIASALLFLSPIASFIAVSVAISVIASLTTYWLLNHLKPGIIINLHPRVPPESNFVNKMNNNVINAKRKNTVVKVERVESPEAKARRELHASAFEKHLGIAPIAQQPKAMLFSDRLNNFKSAVTGACSNLWSKRPQM